MKTFTLKHKGWREGMVRVTLSVSSEHNGTTRDAGFIELTETEWQLFRLLIEAGRRSEALQAGPLVHIEKAGPL